MINIARQEGLQVYVVEYRNISETCIVPCEVCGEVMEYQPEMCRDGQDCTCNGQPIEPPICILKLKEM